eukprot:361917-Chlamydomonas_euryale.AAC.9
MEIIACGKASVKRKGAPGGWPDGVHELSLAHPPSGPLQIIACINGVHELHTAHALTTPSTPSLAKVVHELYSVGGAAVAPVAAAFPSAVSGGAVSRPALSACVVGNDAAMAQLEAIVHPLVAQRRRDFLENVSTAGFGV